MCDAKPVVIFDAVDRSGIAGIRSFREANIPYYLCFNRRTPRHRRIFWEISPYRNRILPISYENKDPSTMIQSLTKIKKEIGPFIIYPNCQKNLSLFMEIEEWLDEMDIGLPLPQKAVWNQMNHKEKFYQVVSDYGMKVPGVMKPFESFPVVVKPKMDVTPNGDTLPTEILHTAELLENFLSHYEEKDFIFQKYIEGPRRIFNSIWNEGTLIDFHGRVTTIQNPNGKHSVRQKPLKIPGIIVKTFSKMLSDLNWHGPIMIEYLKQGQNYYALEANPRFWGSIQFSIDNGFDFPVALYDIATNSDEYESGPEQLKIGYQNISCLPYGLKERLLSGKPFNVNTDTGNEVDHYYDIFIRNDTWYNLFLLNILKSSGVDSYMYQTILRNKNRLTN